MHSISAKACTPRFKYWRNAIFWLLLWVGGGGPLIYVIFFWANDYVWDRDLNNQLIIGKAYEDYYFATKRFPENLKELVRAGYLPQKARFYLEPPGPRGNLTDVGASCYVVQPPPKGSVRELAMIGRRTTLERGQVGLEFDPVANANIRDHIIVRQVPRNEVDYSNYVAPLELELPKSK